MEKLDIEFVRNQFPAFSEKSLFKKAFFENDEVITHKDPRFEALDITATRAEIFKIRASRRGLAIGFVDGMTGAMIPGVVGKMARGLPKKLPKKSTMASSSRNYFPLENELSRHIAPDNPLKQEA